MFNVDRYVAIRSLSSALDFVGIDDVGHGSRVAVLAAQIAKYMGWDDDRVLWIAEAGLIHDCGVSSDVIHGKLASEFHWDGVAHHCLLGAHYLTECPVLSEFSDVVLHHHTPWPTYRDIEKMAPEVMQMANLIFLADRVDITQLNVMNGTKGKDHISLHKAEVVGRITKVWERYFSAELVEAFTDLAETDAFWYSIHKDYTQDYLDNLSTQNESQPLNRGDAFALAKLFACIIDAKSPFTHSHSTRVAAVARELAAQMECDDECQDNIEIAGLLHDAGKLRVPDYILDKPDGLDQFERAVISQHSFDSGHALKGLFPKNRILRWVTMHHEKLDGSGYPNRLKGDEIDLEAQILVVADMYQALAQDRPYRTGLKPQKILDLLKGDVAIGRINPDVVGLLEQNSDRFFRLAIG